MRPTTAQGRTSEGAVTAETAAALPLLAFFALGMVWLISLGVTHLQVVDAARETARSVARGDGDADGVALGRRVAPRGSQISVRSGSETVTVTVRAPVRGPVGLFGFLPTFDVQSQAIAAQEPTS